MSANVEPLTPRPSGRVEVPDLVRRFESCALPPWAFGHREHLFVAWTYLREAAFEDAAPRFVKNVRRFAEHHGAPGKYHATMTWALLALFAEAIDQSPMLGFDALLAKHPELLDAKKTLGTLYSEGVLDSDRARRIPLVPR